MAKEDNSLEINPVDQVRVHVGRSSFTSESSFVADGGVLHQSWTSPCSLFRVDTGAAHTRATLSVFFTRGRNFVEPQKIRQHSEHLLNQASVGLSTSINCEHIRDCRQHADWIDKGWLHCECCSGKLKGQGKTAASRAIWARFH